VPEARKAKELRKLDGSSQKLAQLAIRGFSSIAGISSEIKPLFRELA